MLEVNKVSKKYFKNRVLNNVDLKVGKGKIAGLLGPNGSGKTTLLRMITGELRVNYGSILINGIPVGVETKKDVSFLTNSNIFPDWMTIKDAGEVYDSLFQDFDKFKFKDLLTKVSLSEDMKIKALSKGMRSKFALALTISRKSPLIVLDEPLEGVDPVAREEILGLIIDGFNDETTILVTSHLINELERLLDEVYFINDGEIKYMGAAEDLRNEKHMTLDELYREVYRR